MMSDESTKILTPEDIKPAAELISKVLAQLDAILLGQEELLLMMGGHRSAQEEYAGIQQQIQPSTRIIQLTDLILEVLQVN